MDPLDLNPDVREVIEANRRRAAMSPCPHGGLITWSLEMDIWCLACETQLVKGNGGHGAEVLLVHLPGPVWWWVDGMAKEAV